MMREITSRTFHVLALLLICSQILYAQSDWRNIKYGREIPTKTYADQPYIIKTDDDAWLCILTTGVGREGAPGQVVAVTRSQDGGQTWSDLIYLEPTDGPEASYAVMLKTPSGRVYAFYNHNTDNLRWVKADSSVYKDGKCYRVDSQGYFVFRYTDDHGKTWSKDRYTVPVREFEIDRNNPYQGKIRYFWNVGKAFTYEGKGYVPLIKVGGLGRGFFTSNEGVLLMSPNILTEKNPEKLRWETLPDGDAGLRTPPGGGPISAEQSYCVLSDGSFYVVYRSVDGHPVYSYSRDKGHTWDIPRYKTYADGTLMKHPRAANFAWKCTNGKYLYWFHNHGGKSYEDRNPVWISGGVEIDSPDGKIIQWSQPEILFYDDDPFVRMSYPDLVEEGGAYYFTETQKSIARIHEVDRGLLEGLWGQFQTPKEIVVGALLDFGFDSGRDRQVEMPLLPDFVTRDNESAEHGGKNLYNGFTIEMRLKLSTLDPGQIIMDNRTKNGQGFVVRTTSQNTLEISMNDGRTESSWDADPVILPGTDHHIAIVVDGGPKIISFVVDGKLCDGGEYRQFGWGRFSPHLRHANGGEQLRIGDQVSKLRIYDRPLRISEVVDNFKAESN